MKNIKLLIIQVNQYALSNKKKKKSMLMLLCRNNPKKKKCIINGTKKIINLSDKYITHQTTQNYTLLPSYYLENGINTSHTHTHTPPHIALKLRGNSIRF